MISFNLNLDTSNHLYLANFIWQQAQDSVFGEGNGIWWLLGGGLILWLWISEQSDKKQESEYQESANESFQKDTMDDSETTNKIKEPDFNEPPKRRIESNYNPNERKQESSSRKVKESPNSIPYISISRISQIVVKALHEASDQDLKNTLHILKDPQLKVQAIREYNFNLKQTYRDYLLREIGYKHNDSKYVGSLNQYIEKVLKVGEDYLLESYLRAKTISSTTPPSVEDKFKREDFN